MSRHFHPALVTSLSLLFLVSLAQSIAGTSVPLQCHDQPRQFFNPEIDNCDDCLSLDNDPLLLASQCRQYAACCISDADASAGASPKLEQVATAPTPPTPSPLPVTTSSAPELNVSILSDTDKPANSTVSSSTIATIVASTVPVVVVVALLVVIIPVVICCKKRGELSKRRRRRTNDDAERGPLRDDGNEEPAQFSNSLANSASTVSAQNPLFRHASASGDMNAPQSPKPDVQTGEPMPNDSVATTDSTSGLYDYINGDGVSDTAGSDTASVSSADAGLPSGGRPDTAANRIVYNLGPQHGSQHVYGGNGGEMGSVADVRT